MAEETPLVVTKEEYEAEQREIALLEATHARLAGEWASKTTGLTLVPREEYERQEAEIRAMEKRLSELWRRWGRYAARRRWALVRELKRTAAAYLGLIRTTLREALSLRGELEAARRLHERKVILTPELETLRRRIRETWEKLETEKRRLARKIVAELIGTEQTTGYDILYNADMERYLVRHPRTKELLRIENKLLIEVTCSIEDYMEGKDVPIALELTGMTLAQKMGKEEITKITDKEGPIKNAVFNWLMDLVKDRPAQKPGWEKLSKTLVGTIDFSYMGASEEPKREYPCKAPDYPKIRLWLERRSRYIEYRRYPTKGCAEVTAG